MLPSSKTNATDEQSRLRKDVQDSRNRTVYTDWPGNSSLYVNYRKGNDYSPVTFSLAVTRFTLLSRLMKPSTTPSQHSSASVSGRTRGVKEM